MHFIIYFLLKNNPMHGSKFQSRLLDENLDAGLNGPPTNRTGSQRDGASKHEVSQSLLQEVSADGEGARFAETQVAARLDQDGHL